MSSTPLGLIWREGTPPEQFGYPGHGYRTTIENGIIIERDVTVRLRDGVEMYIDVFRPEGQEQVPALICWSPYGKHAPLSWDFWPGAGVDPKKISKITAFEALDPVYWCPQGYAVIYPDPRGTWGSQGEATFFSSQEAGDAYDLIEWAGTQPWSSGKVGMGGVSYLAWSQWKVATLNPPHLAAINPWEGVSDFYREFAFHGGIPDTQFVAMVQMVSSASKSRVEDYDHMRELHPLFDDYWQSKNADLSKITVPAYVVASWTDHGLHTRGTLEGFKQISSEHKFLEIHGRKKWQYFYDDASVERQRQFFDRFLKGIQNEVDNWPKVRLEVRDRFYEGEFRDETEWPLARTEYRKLYLDACTGSAGWSRVDEESEVRYDPQAEDQAARFDFRFEETTELIGHMKLRLWVEADGSDDMDLFVGIQKLDRDGKLVPFPFFATFDDGNVALGWLRVSHRELDEKRSTPEQPWLLHQRELMLKPGEIVPVDIEIWPAGTHFAAGESLRVVVKGNDINKYPPELFANRHDSARNRGQHVIHTGGKYDSHLLVPVIPGRGSAE